MDAATFIEALASAPFGRWTDVRGALWVTGGTGIDETGVARGLGRFARQVALGQLIDLADAGRIDDDELRANAAQLNLAFIAEAAAQASGQPDLQRYFEALTEWDVHRDDAATAWGMRASRLVIDRAERDLADHPPGTRRTATEATWQTIANAAGRAAGALSIPLRQPALDLLTAPFADVIS